MALFFCTDCKKAINSGLFADEVYTFEGKPYCKDCFEKNHLTEFKEKEAAEAVRIQKDTADFITSTTNEINGYRIIKYIELYHTYVEEGTRSFNQALTNMRNRAVASGGNAVIGVQITNFVQRSPLNGMYVIFTSICGTIVRVEKIEA